MIQTQYSILDSWLASIFYGQSVEFCLVEVEKYLLILFLPSCKASRHESKVTEKDNLRLQWKASSFHALFH